MLASNAGPLSMCYTFLVHRLPPIQWCLIWLTEERTESPSKSVLALNYHVVFTRNVSILKEYFLKQWTVKNDDKIMHGTQKMSAHKLSYHQAKTLTVTECFSKRCNFPEDEYYKFFNVYLSSSWYSYLAILCPWNIDETSDLLASPSIHCRRMTYHLSCPTCLSSIIYLMSVKCQSPSFR